MNQPFIPKKRSPGRFAGTTYVNEYHDALASLGPILKYGNADEPLFPRSQIFPAKVEKTGGSDGTDSTVASWTYTVRTIQWNGTSGGSELGTVVVVTRPRAKGKMTFQTGSQGYGIAFYDAGVLKLWDAGEIPVTDTQCDT